jgi:hypothetical protein
MELEGVQVGILEYEPNSHRLANQRGKIGLRFPLNAAVECVAEKFFAIVE